jgi:FtsP/CotA-like multicopper oxidase with cupredoxin domain
MKLNNDPEANSMNDVALSKIAMKSSSRRSLLRRGMAISLAAPLGVPVLQAAAQTTDHAGMDTGTPIATAGTDMQQGMPSGHDMSPVDVRDAVVVSPDTHGNQVLEPTIVDGVKEFQLTTSIVRWNILPDVQVGAYAYNEQVPGPLIRVVAGDSIRIHVTNKLPEPTSVHWHGLILPNAMDGVAGITQPPIEPGDTFTYEFIVPNSPGTFFYHSHFAADRQQTLGLYGAFLIDGVDQPAKTYDQEYIVQLGEWRIENGQTLPAMELEGMLPNYFTINGKSFPDTDTIRMKVGNTVLIRFIGTGQFIHPMHIHGGPFTIAATDGNPVPDVARLKKDTVLVGPGERYDVLWTAHEPGKWLIHCHINHHITNNGAEVDGAGGLTMLIDVAP